jgi:hypothetical protein
MQAGVVFTILLFLLAILADIFIQKKNNASSFEEKSNYQLAFKIAVIALIMVFQLIELKVNND